MSNWTNRKYDLDAPLRSPEGLRARARVRVEEAMRHPPHSDEHRRNMAIAAQYEREAEAAR